MQIQIKELPKSEILLTVELAADELTKYENEAAKHVSEQVEIPGFRKGQAPKAFVIAQIGADGFLREVLNVALPRSYFNAIKEKNLKVISRPDIKVITKSPLKYEARVGILPAITVKGWEKLKIPSETVEVTDKEIDEVVQEMRKYRATFKTLDRAIQKGDRVEVDFQGFDETGVALDKTKSSNHPLFVGEGTLVPGFEEQLIGMKAGEKKKFPVKFPKDFYHEPLKGKTVHFEVDMKRAEEPVLPAIDDEFVKQIMGEPKTVDDFKTALKQDLHKKKTAESRKNRENTLLEKLLHDAKLEVPPVLIEEEIDYMLEDFKRELEAKKLSFDTYMQKMQKEKRDLKKEYEPEAEKRIRIRLILNYLFGELKIDVSEEEISRAGERLIDSMPEAQRKGVKEQLDKKGELYVRLKNNLMLEKLFAKFLD